MSTILDLMNNPAPKDFCNKKKVSRDFLVELIGTTLFVYAGTLSAVSTGAKLVAQGNVAEGVARILPIAVTFGVSILSMAYSIGHLSGCHLNPGVSLMMFFRRKMSIHKMLSYWIAQLVGALAGAALTWGSTSSFSGISKFDGSEVARPPFLLGSTTLNDELTSGNGLLLEFMGSFFFYFVIAMAALDERGIAKTSFPGIPIGLSLVVVHICLIPFTGCGVNPARTFGPSMIVCMSSYDECSDVAGDWYWIYYIGPFLASFFVAEVTNLMNTNVDDEEEDKSGVEKTSNPGDEEDIDIKAV